MSSSITQAKIADEEITVDKLRNSVMQPLVKTPSKGPTRLVGYFPQPTNEEAQRARDAKLRDGFGLDVSTAEFELADYCANHPDELQFIIAKFAHCPECDQQSRFLEGDYICYWCRDASV